jgi:probable O-glycosylation ligase (exosortase A-associated)
MFRSIFVVLLILIGLRYCFKGAFYVLLFYIWMAYFRPEQWLWYDFVSPMRLSLSIGILLCIAGFFARDKFRFGPGQILLVAFLLHGMVSTIVSPWAEWAWPGLIEFGGIAVITYFITMLVNTEQRLRLMVMVMAFSLSFEGAKQGWARLVLDPGGINENFHKMLGDNNGVAVGMLMTVPLLTALARSSTRRLEKYADRFLAIGMIYRALSTYSRGGFVSCAGLALHYLFTSGRKVVAALAIAVMTGLLIYVVPDAYWDRMETIPGVGESDEARPGDTSMESRMYFWEVGLDMAKSRPAFGVGPKAYEAAFNYYAGTQWGRNRAVHSSWFGMLAETGFFGFAIFLAILGLAFFETWRVRRLARRNPDLVNLGHYATAFQGSLVVFCLGGTFVSFHYMEYVWHVVGLSWTVGHLANQRMAALAESSFGPPATAFVTPRLEASR